MPKSPEGALKPQEAKPTEVESQEAEVIKMPQRKIKATDEQIAAEVAKWRETKGEKLKLERLKEKPHTLKIGKGALRLEKIETQKKKQIETQGEGGKKEKKIKTVSTHGWKVTEVVNVPGIKEGQIFTADLKNAPKKIQEAAEGKFVMHGDEFDEWYGDVPESEY